MKKIFKTALMIALGSFALTSCRDKDNYDYEAEALKAEQRIDSLLTAEKTKIEDYKNQFLPTATQDSLNYNFYYLNKKNVKRGIWYSVDSEPTDNSYTYSLNASGTQLTYPKLKLKYTVKNLSNKVVESDLTGTDYNLGIQSSKITNIWFISFFPYSIKFNGTDSVLGGLTKEGLKKGSKFTVITPSIFAYGSKSQTDIPANSPLVYEFEVLEINN